MKSRFIHRFPFAIHGTLYHSNSHVTHVISWMNVANWRYSLSARAGTCATTHLSALGVPILVTGSFSLATRTLICGIVANLGSWPCLAGLPDPLSQQQQQASTLERPPTWECPSRAHTDPPRSRAAATPAGHRAPLPPPHAPAAAPPAAPAGPRCCWPSLGAPAGEGPPPSS